MKCILWKNGTCTREKNDIAANVVAAKKACYIPKSVYWEYQELANSTEPEARNKFRALKEKYLTI